MNNSSLSLPDQRNYERGYKLAYELAGEKLAKVDGIEQQCLKSGARYLEIDSQQLIIVEYLNQSYQITLPDVEISLVDSEEEVPIRDKILILHYLTQAKGNPLTNEVIAYKQLPGGSNYFPTFYKRAIKPLVDHFGGQPNRLMDAAKELGGYKADYGDTGATINAFSRVPITLVMWRGDEEFPPEGNILFDATISDYLSTEDINVLCEIIAWKLVKYLKEGNNRSSGS
jgi:hypothetical protein